MGQVTKSKKLKFLPYPEWLVKAGMSKGIDHDRQHLGIILAAGETIRVRQVNTEFKGQLKLRLLNDNQKTQRSINFNLDWIELSVDAVSVPFINTPYSDAIIPEIVFEYPDTSKLLPFYERGEDERIFFEHWDKQDAEFGIVESEYVIILAPKASKDRLKSFSTSGGIDKILEFYQGIFAFNNSLAGLSFEPQRYSDENTRNRYFAKADKGGGGAAYYSNNWVASSSGSINTFWLSPNSTNWGCLHEIAHGYQGGFIDDKYFSTREVWNNIYAACYQDVMLGTEKFNKGWLYNFGKQKEVEKGILNNISNGKKVNSWGPRSKLYFIMLMLEKAGVNCFTYFNQIYRERKNLDKSVPSVLDMLSNSFATVENRVDVTPFIQIVGGHISQEQYQRNLFSHAKAVYPLNKILQGDELSFVKKTLNLNSELSLVDVDNLEFTDIKSNMTLQFSIDDFTQIYGEELLILNGDNYVYNQSIMDKEQTIYDLPIGAYTLRIPTGRNKKYAPQNNYLIANNEDSPKNIDFVHRIGSSIASQKISLRGLSDYTFATIFIDQENATVIVDITKEKPHYHFPGMYAGIIIKDKDNNELINEVITGTNQSLSKNTLPLSSCYYIEIFHKEPGRIKLIPEFKGVIDNKSTTNTFIITPYGLQNIKLNNDPKVFLLDSINSAVEALRSQPIMWHANFSEAKDNIYLAIDIFPSPRKEALLEQYSDCISPYYEKPNEDLGNRFSFVFKGINDRIFLSAELNLVTKKLEVKIMSGTAHSGFNRTYAVLRYFDADGNELLNLEVIGSKKQMRKTWEFPISGYGGEKLYLQHEEPKSRLVVTNIMQEIRLSSRQKTQNYEIEPLGLSHDT